MKFMQPYSVALIYINLFMIRFSFRTVTQLSAHHPDTKHFQSKFMVNNFTGNKAKLVYKLTKKKTQIQVK